MKKSLMFISSILCLAMVASCSSDSEDDLPGTDDEPGNDAVTYVASIRPIMSSNCIGCHASPPTNGAPFPLVSFADVQSRAGGIINAVSKQTGEARAMPPSGRLPQATINLIQQWIDEGTPEN